MNPLASAIAMTPDGPPTDLQRKMAGVILDAFFSAGFSAEAGMAAVVNAYAESRLNPSAWGDRASDPEGIGCSGGLFQLNRCAGLGKGLTRQEVLDPWTNIATIIRAAHRSKLFRGADPLDAAALSSAMTRDILRPSKKEEKARARAALLSIFWPTTRFGVETTSPGWRTRLVRREEGEGSGRVLHVDPPSPWYLPPWSEGRVDRDWSEAQKLSSLDPTFRASIVSVLSRLRAEGFSPVVWFGWRRPGMQAELVKKGRSRAPFSFHEALGDSGEPAALAVDLVDRRYGWGTTLDEGGGEVKNPKTFAGAKRFFTRLGTIAEEEGLWWGGRFSAKKGTVWGDVGIGWDPGHVQGRPGSDLPDVAEATKSIWKEGLARQALVASR